MLGNATQLQGDHAVVITDNKGATEELSPLVSELTGWLIGWLVGWLVVG